MRWAGHTFLIQYFSQTHTELSKTSDIWNPASFLISHQDSTNTSSQKTCSNAENSSPAFLLPPSLVFYSSPCPSTDVHAARVGEVTPLAATCVISLRMNTRLHKRKEQYGSENKELWTKEGLLQLGTAAECIEAMASAITVWNAKDNIRKDTANGLREIGLDNRNSQEDWCKHLSDLIRNNSSPHTNAGTQNRLEIMSAVLLQWKWNSIQSG